MMEIHGVLDERRSIEMHGYGFECTNEIEEEDTKFRTGLGSKENLKCAAWKL